MTCTIPSTWNWYGFSSRSAEADSVVAALRELGEEAWCIGEIQKVRVV